MQCYQCKKELDLKEYTWTHRHEPIWYIKAIGAFLMGIGLGSIILGIHQIVFS